MPRLYGQGCALYIHRADIQRKGGIGQIVPADPQCSLAACSA